MSLMPASDMQAPIIADRSVDRPAPIGAAVCGHLSIMKAGMIAMTLALTVAAMVQISMETVTGLPFMEVQSYLGVFYAIRF